MPPENTPKNNSYFSNVTESHRSHDENVFPISAVLSVRIVVFKKGASW